MEHVETCDNNNTTMLLNGGEVIVILFVKSIIAMQHVETCGIVRPRDWQFTCW